MWRDLWLIHTLIPSSSLTLRIILTHISVILLKVGCSRQISLRILITRFLTLIPVSCTLKMVQFKQVLQCSAIIFIKKGSFSYPRRHICMGCNRFFSANRWQYETEMKIELLMNSSQHFHDNRNNNFKAFTAHLPNIKEQVQSFCVCLTSCQYP